MTSWIIVSSRCVLGSSNGTRQFSASSTVNKPAASSTAPAPAEGESIVTSETLPVCTLSDSTAVIDGRFREHRITDFARRAHAFEGRAGFQRRPRRAKPRQRQQVNQQQHVAAETQRAARRAQRQQHRRAQQRHPRHRRPGDKARATRACSAPRPCATSCARS